MDNRKRRIDELEKQKRESSSSLDSLLERLGESLFSRIKGSEADYEDITEYYRLKKSIADSNSSIQNIEEQINRIKELEDAIRLAED